MLVNIRGCSVNIRQIKYCREGWIEYHYYPINTYVEVKFLDGEEIEISTRSREDSRKLVKMLTQLCNMSDEEVLKIIRSKD